MTALEDSLRHIASALASRQVGHALVGGLAVSIRAEPRLTRDADLAVATASDADAEALIQDLRRDGYAVIAAIEQDRVGRLATVRLVRPTTTTSVVDLLFASSGIEPEIVAGSERLEVLPGLVLPVANVGHLLVMKVLARDDRRRPADADDLAGLAAIAADDDWDQAAEAARLVQRRGFARGRDLVGALDRLRHAVNGGER